MESRIRRKVYVRFGEGDTPYPKGSTVPTLRPDASRAPAGRCKHRWAKALLVQALTHVTQHSALPIEGLPTPYAFPRWRTYEATCQGPESSGKAVNGIAELLEPGLFVFWPTDKRTCWHCAYQEVALGPGLEEG
jgi:hypothetical protein